jgi:hypothetical protein
MATVTYCFYIWKNVTYRQGRQCTYKRKAEARFCNHFFCGKAVSITHFECLFEALVNQHAMRMRHIVICCLSGFTIVFHIILQQARFTKRRLSNIICAFGLSLQLLSESFLILGRIKRNIVLNVHWSSCKNTRYSSPILMKLEFSQ